MLLADDLVVLNCLFESVVKEARVVDKRDGHEATKARDSFKVHLLFAYYFWNESVLSSLDDVLLVLLDLLTGIAGFFIGILVIFTALLENFV